MKPRQRREWVARYIAEHEPRSGVDVLNQAFNVSKLGKVFNQWLTRKVKS